MRRAYQERPAAVGNSWLQRLRKRLSAGRLAREHVQRSSGREVRRIAYNTGSDGTRLFYTVFFRRGNWPEAALRAYVAVQSYAGTVEPITLREIVRLRNRRWCL